MFFRPKILFLISLLFVALLNPKYNPYLLLKFFIFYHSIIYCNYSHYYFKRSALYPTESCRCMNLLAAVPAAQQLYS